MVRIWHSCSLGLGDSEDKIVHGGSKRGAFHGIGGVGKFNEAVHGPSSHILGQIGAGPTVRPLHLGDAMKDVGAVPVGVADLVEHLGKRL